MNKQLIIFLNIILILLSLFFQAFLCYYLSSQQISHYYHQLATYYIIFFNCSVITISVYTLITLCSHADILNISQSFDYLYDRNYKAYYSNQIINQIFLISFGFIQILHSESISLQIQESVYFVACYFLASTWVFYFSKQVFKRRSLYNQEILFYDEGVFRCAYEIYYYAFTFFIIFGHFTAQKMNHLSRYHRPVIDLLLNNSVYMFYSFTKLSFIVNFFCLFAFIHTLKDSIEIINERFDTYTITCSCVLLVSIVNLIRILLKYYQGIIKVLRLRTDQNNQDIDYLAAINNLPQRPPIQQIILRQQNNAITQGQIQNLNYISYVPSPKKENENDNDLILNGDDNNMNHNYCQEEVNQNLQQFKKFEQAHYNNSKVCSICSVELIEKDQLIELPCKHIFHRPCLLQWLLIKNSCPLCRVIAAF